MASIWPLFKQKLATVNIDFNLLPGLLEAKYGGISTLKLVVPHAPTVQKWVVIEMGKGSTQITRFAKKDYVELSNELWNKEQEEAMLKFNQEFEQQDFKQQRRSSIKKETNDQWTTHFNPDTNQTFYHNELTGVSQYNDPNVAPQEEPQAYIQAEFAKKRRSSMSTNIGNTEWAVHTDPKTKDIFYHNSKTGLSCWTIPEDASEKTTDQMQKAFQQAQFTQKRRASVVEKIDQEWEEHTDPNTNQVFYHNQKTGVSSWDAPTVNLSEMLDELKDLDHKIGEIDEIMVQQAFSKKRRSSISEKINEEWTVHTDSATNSIFYHNEITGVSTWELPNGILPFVGTEEIEEDVEDEDEDENDEDEDEDGDYDTQEDYADGEDNNEPEEDPEDDVPEDAYESLLTQQRSLVFETRKWKAHAEQMEQKAAKLERKERGLLAELNHLESLAVEWRDRALSSEKALLGFDATVNMTTSTAGTAELEEELKRAWDHIDALNKARERENAMTSEIVQERDYFSALLQQQGLSQQQKRQQQSTGRRAPDYAARRNWY